MAQKELRYRITEKGLRKRLSWDILYHAKMVLKYLSGFRSKGRNGTQIQNHFAKEWGHDKKETSGHLRTLITKGYVERKYL